MYIIEFIENFILHIVFSIAILNQDAKKTMFLSDKKN